jgi:hypothetical protein
MMSVVLFGGGNDKVTFFNCVTFSLWPNQMAFSVVKKDVFSDRYPSLHYPKSHQQFQIISGNAEGNSSNGRKLFMDFFPLSIWKFSENL